jgi:hypothetical protein
LLPGTIFADRDQGVLKTKKRGDLMQSFVTGKGGPSSKRPIQEQSGAPLVSAAATIGSEENLKARISDLEYQLRQNEEELIKVNVQMAEEIQRLNSELQAMRLLLNAKPEQTKQSKRRSKLRVYLP